MSDTLRSGGDIEQQKQQSLPQSPDIIERQKKLEKLGIVVDSEILERIEADASAKTAFEQDLAVVENNPTEKARFEQLYIQGYWQAVETPFGKLSFAQIQKHPERNKILDGMKRGEKASFRDWEEQVGISEWKKIDEKTQVAIESNSEREKRLEMNQRLEKELDDIKKINWVPKPTPEELKKNAQNIPELKWVPIEEIQSSDKYNNILLADYYVRNATEIGRNLNPEDTKKFQDSINSLSDTLGRPRIEKFEALTKQLVLGENRDKIESIGKELIKSGYSPDVKWNPQDRTMTFTNEKWEKRIIDTARIPPTQRIQNGAVELSSILPEKKENPYTKTREQQEQSTLQVLDKWARLPITGWNEVQSAQTTTDKLQKSLPILDKNIESLTKRLEGEMSEAKRVGIEGETEEIKAIKELLSSIQVLRTEIIEAWGKFAETRKKEKEEDMTINPEISLDTGRANINDIASTGIWKFEDMNEVGSFLSTINSPSFGNNFSDTESINSYLSGNRLTPEQVKSIFSQVVELYSGLTGNKEIQNLSRNEQYRMIMGQDENGKSRIENALKAERLKQDGRILNKGDFKRILWNTEWQKSEVS
jgi:hypothetical protein